MSKTLILWALLIALVIVPFLLPNGGRYEGSDGQAEAAISQLAPDYQPWFSPLFEPASGEVESLLFTLQGCLGTAVIFYILGFYRGKKSAQAQQGKRHADHR